MFYEWFHSAKPSLQSTKQLLRGRLTIPIFTPTTSLSLRAIVNPLNKKRKIQAFSK